MNCLYILFKDLEKEIIIIIIINLLPRKNIRKVTCNCVVSIHDDIKLGKLYIWGKGRESGGGLERNKSEEKEKRIIIKWSRTNFCTFLITVWKPFF